MLTTRATIRTAAVATATALCALTSVAATAPARADSTTCLQGAAPDGATYKQTFVPGAKKKSPPTLVSGTFTGYYALGGASCAGVTYTLHVLSTNGASLDFQSAAPTPSTATVTDNGTEVVVAWPGDLTTTQFLTQVTTGPAYTATCVDSYATIEVGGSVVARGPATGAVHSCSDGSGGGLNYFG